MSRWVCARGGGRKRRREGGRGGIDYVSAYDDGVYIDIQLLISFFDACLCVGVLAATIVMTEAAGRRRKGRRDKKEGRPQLY
jgi:hypothetical protein